MAGSPSTRSTNPRHWREEIPASRKETLETGMLSSSPAIPDDDLDTIGLQWLLVAQSRMSSTTAEDLARTIYENKASSRWTTASLQDRTRRRR